jgi:hypothetical protein
VLAPADRAPGRPRPKRLQRLSATLGLAATISGAVVAIETSEAAGASVWYVKPGGTGDCTSTRPCGSIDAAFAKATAGDHIQLAAGTYPKQTIIHRNKPAGFTQNVVVRPASGARVVVKGVDLQVPRVTLRDFEIEGGRIWTAAWAYPYYTRVERMKLRNSSIYLNNADNGAVVGSEIWGGMNKDGINIKDGSNNVLVEGNHVHDMAHDGSSGVHVDCLQIFNATNITVRKNRLARCSQSALLVQTRTGGGEAPTKNIHVYNNVLQTCRDAPCQNRDTALQAVGHSSYASNYRITNNVIEGWAFAEPVPSMVFRNNLLRRFFHRTKALCGTSYEAHNLVAELGICSRVSSTDRIGWPTFAQPRYTADPKVTPEHTTKLAFADTAVAPPTDYYGSPRCGTRDVGADELGCY